MAGKAVMATRLDAEVVHATALRLRERIRARFPSRDLGRVAGELLELVDEVRQPSRSHRWLDVLRRVCRALIVVLLVTVPIVLGTIIVRGVQEVDRSIDWLAILESAINDLVFTGIAILFLWAAPDRLARHGELAVLHRLRSLAHVIDMHQLTKDPERYRPDFQPTEASIDVDLTPTELSQYLEYCSELLSLVGKTAALFANNATDRIVLDGVHDIESLTSDLSRQIWQKISLLPSLKLDTGDAG